jgi:hypothetical protein
MNTCQLPSPTFAVHTRTVFDSTWVILLLAKVESFLPANEDGQCNFAG